MSFGNHFQPVWQWFLKKGGKLILNVINDVKLHKGAQINLNGKGYQGGQPRQSESYGNGNGLCKKK